MTSHRFTYLALGDSYTIGEGVPLHESFPYQTVQLLRKQGYHFHAAEIIAQTGWTTFELANQLNHTALNKSYDFVTLLIGVNNQYRGLNIQDFTEEATFLLKKAIHLAQNNSQHVIVISIPDWSYTPFAQNRDLATISKEIDAYNQIAKKIASQHQVHFIDITPGTRLAQNDEGLLTQDKLHYSANEMSHWASAVATIIQSQIIKPQI